MNKNIIKINSYFKEGYDKINMLEIKNLLASQTNSLFETTGYFYDQIDSLINAILFSKLGILHPDIITPQQLYLGLSCNIKNLPSGKEFPLSLKLEIINYLIDVSDLIAYYIDGKLIFITKLPLVTSQEFNLFRVIPLPVPNTDIQNTFS